MPPKRKSMDSAKGGKRKKAKPTAKGKKKPQKKVVEEEEEEDEIDDTISITSDPELNEEEDVAESSNSEDNDFEKLSLPEYSGTLLIAGKMNWNMDSRIAGTVAGKSTAQVLYEANIFSPLEKVKIKVAVSSGVASHSVVIDENGNAYTFGRNKKGQLGSGSSKETDKVIQPEELKNLVVVNAAVGRHHSLFLTEKGHVYSCGDNTFGQCGIGSKTASLLIPTRIKYTGPPIVKIACGAEFSMIVNSKGVLLCFGHPEYGQLGLGRTGQYIEKAGKILYSTETSPVPVTHFIEMTDDNHIAPVDVTPITDVACGNNHTVCIDSKNRVFTWGFGAYGRLGHCTNKDELFPRLIKYFDNLKRGITKIWCGSSYTFVMDDLNQLFFWGQTKKTGGEATMYPKLYRDLSGWNVQSIGCGYSSVLFLADNKLIVWGGSPTTGELALGEERKSSAQPLENKKFADNMLHSISCGAHHSLFIAKSENKDQKNQVQKFKKFDPSKKPK